MVQNDTLGVLECHHVLTLFQFMRCKECFLRVCVCVYVSIYLIAVYLAFWLSVATVCYVSFRSLYILNAGHPC